MSPSRSLLPRFAVAVSAIALFAAVAAATGVLAHAEGDACDECQPAARIADGRAATSLEHARERWAAQELTDYSFAVEVSCFCSGVRERKVVVRDGKAVHPPKEVRSVSTVELLFATIEHAIQERYHVLRVRYDRRTGMPRLIATEPAAEQMADGTVQMTSDTDIRYSAGKLRPLRHR